MTTDARTVASSDRGSRASLPGSRRAFLAAAVVSLGAAIVLVMAIAGTFSSGGVQRNALGEPVAKSYGHPPAWETIPEPTKPKMVVATPQTPDLKAMEGYPVAAHLAGGGSVQISAEGPSVPAWVTSQGSNGQLNATSSVPGTFDVTLSNARGHVALSPAQFTVINYEGLITHPTVTNLSGGPIPKTIAPGQTVKLAVKTPVINGDGEIRWAPDTKRILVGYFWTLELN